jgi:hypothetical protein
MMAPQKYYGDEQKQNTYLCKSDKSQMVFNNHFNIWLFYLVVTIGNSELNLKKM